MYSTYISSNPLTDKCIVLDLDETLVHSCEEDHLLRELGIWSDPRLIGLRDRCYNMNIDDVVGPLGKGEKSQIWGITRPHAREFLQFCFRYFRIVAVWSAGQTKYVDAICEYLFKDLEPPHVIYSYPECDNNGGVRTKPLRKMFEEPPLRGMMLPENTLAIDDRDTTFLSPNPHNGIVIPAYEPNIDVQSLFQDDTALLELMDWFSKPDVMRSKNVQSLDKSDIFSP